MSEPQILSMDNVRNIESDAMSGEHISTQDVLDLVHMVRAKEADVKDVSEALTERSYQYLKLYQNHERLQAECAAMRKALETIVFHEHNYDAYSTAVDIAQEALGKLREQVAE